MAAGPFKIVRASTFDSSFEAVLKHYRKDQKGKAELAEQLAQFGEQLSRIPWVPGAAPEPYPNGAAANEDETLYKIRFKMPRLRGAVGQGRCLYLLDAKNSQIVFLLVYTHKDHRSRPPPRDLVQAILAARDTISGLVDT